MIPNFYRYRLRINGNSIDDGKKKIFLDRFNDLSGSDECELIFRGDKRSRILQAYKLTDYDMPTPFTYKLFLIGPKGRNFLEDLSEEAKNKKRFEVSDTTNSFFATIFDMLFKLLNETFLHAKLNYVVESFKVREKQLLTYFSDKNNKKEFLKKLKTLNQSDKILLRDYYLTLLHHISESEYYPISFMLSVTTDFKVAVQFSKSAKKENNEIILFGWIPKNKQKIQPAFRYLRTSEQIRELGFPTYKIPFFPRQKEITLKGGLLPHYLLGFLYSEDGVEYFEINPSLFEELDKNWIVEGLPVNQDEFWDELKKTNMAGGFYVNETGTYKEVKIKS